MKVKNIFSVFILALLISNSYLFAETVEVVIENFSFSPQTITINVGDTVRWTNKDSVQHTSSSGTPNVLDGVWNSGLLMQGGVYEFTFNTAGVYNYFCEVHPSMTGSITVNESQNDLDVTLSTDKSQYLDGDNFTLSASVESNSSVNVDVYIWAETPDGSKFFLTGSLLFGDINEVLPFVSSWQSFDVAPSSLFQTVITGLPVGNYKFHVLILEAGAAFDDTSKIKAHNDVSFTIQ